MATEVLTPAAFHITEANIINIAGDYHDHSVKSFAGTAPSSENQRPYCV